MAQQAEAAYAALIGIDWADQQHDYCLSAAGTESVESGTVGARPEDLHTWINQLRKRFQGQKIAICLEPIQRSFDPPVDGGGVHRSIPPQSTGTGELP